MPLLKNLMIFGVGVWCGVYMDQNYEVPRVDQIGVLWDRLREFAEANKKEQGKDK